LDVKTDVIAHSFFEVMIGSFYDDRIPPLDVIFVMTWTGTKELEKGSPTLVILIITV